MLRVFSCKGLKVMIQYHKLPRVLTFLTHLLPVYLFSTPWKTSENRKPKDALVTNGLNLVVHMKFSIKHSTKSVSIFNIFSEIL